MNSQINNKTNNNSALKNIPHQYSLHNTDNYFNTISYNCNDILNKYELLITEYLHFIFENVILKNNHNNKFILFRGLTTISHVFQFILYYSKNLNMAYYHSQKAFYYYIEFIEQITGEQNSFLQLTSKDALMFVYRKTIFEIHQEYRKSNVFMNHENENDKYNFLDIYIKIIKNIITDTINYIDSKNDEFVYINNLKLITQNISLITQSLIQLKLFINYLHIFIENFSTINDNITIEKYFDIINVFFKKIIKNKKYQNQDTFDFVFENMLKIDHESLCKENTEKIVNLILPKV